MSYISKVENDSIVLQIKELYEDIPELKYYPMDREHYPKVKVLNIKRCSSCDKSETEVKMSGHLKKCKWRKNRKLLESLFSDLTKWELKNIELIIQEIDE